jgi:hypothetical protein
VELLICEVDRAIAIANETAILDMLLPPAPVSVGANWDRLLNLELRS